MFITTNWLSNLLLVINVYILAPTSQAYNKIPQFDFAVDSTTAQLLSFTDAEVKCNNTGNEVIVIQNPGFELGLTYWNTYGTTSLVTNGCYSGNICVRAGSVVATDGDSGISQSFTAIGHQNLLSFYYKMTCPDKVTFDWVTAKLLDHTMDITWTILSPLCNSTDWTLLTTTVIAGHSYTLFLTNHDDYGANDPSYTDFDNILL
jgi:serine protease